MEENSPVVTIGNYTRIGQDTVFYGNVNYPSIVHPELVANYSFQNHEGFPFMPGMEGKGPINIGNDVWMGNKCHVFSGVTIGDGAIIGMGSFVNHDIPPYTIAVGYPARIIRVRFDPEIIEKLLKIKWWDWDDDKVKNNIRSFLDVHKFVEEFYEN
jgi:acetyltransferase-like isoleucine patch superfamily enzyme